MTDVPALLFAGFDLWPGPSAWARRVTEAVQAAAGRHRVLTLSIRHGTLPHTESVLGARALRVPLPSGSLLGRVEAFARAVQRQLDGDVHAVVHTADPFVGAAVLTHSSRTPLLYEARRLPSAELPLLLARGHEGPVLEAALRRWERTCLLRARAALATTRGRAEEIRAGERIGPLQLVPDAIELEPEPHPRRPGPLRIRHVGWDLSDGALRLLVDAARQLGPDARLHVVQPPAVHWTGEVRRGLAAAARQGVLTVGSGAAVPHGWADVDVLGGLGPDARGPAVLGEALPAFAEGRPVLAADSEAARADLPAGCTVFVPGASADALVEALKTLAGDPDLRAGAGAEARAYVARRHDPAHVRGLLRDVYRALGAVRAETPLDARAVSAGFVGRGWAPRPRPGGPVQESTDPGTPSGRFG